MANHNVYTHCQFNMLKLLKNCNRVSGAHTTKTMVTDAHYSRHGPMADSQLKLDLG